MRRFPSRALLPLGLSLLTGVLPLRGTIVGLNQIVTPDIQPTGVLALSAQVQHSRIGNSQQLQAELGLTPRWEVGWFQGLTPGEGMFGTELNFVHAGPHLVTAGVINWSTRGGGAQPVLEYGYDGKRDHVTVGALHANGHPDLLLGYKREVRPDLSVSADFQSGSTGSTTLGFTYNLTANLSVNPAIYYTNSHPHHLLGYVVFTWNVPVWTAPPR